MRAMSESDELTEEFKRCQARIEKRLDACFLALRVHENYQEFSELLQSECFTDTGGSYETLLESMRYSLFAGGKRIRPVICVKFCEAVGGDQSPALNAACAIEMLHTYSLIHDDLPCMDDDDFRRGKLSNHAKYGEFIATLAGDALQAAAFEVLLTSGISSDRVVTAAAILAEAAGAHGICAGQYLDISGNGKNISLNDVEKVHMLKTSALISAAAKIGVIAANGTSEQINAAERYAHAVGLAFQVRDDVLDWTSTTEELGKPAGSDKDNGKTTFYSLLGAGKCEEIIRIQTNMAVASLQGKFADTAFLEWFARSLAVRRT